MIGIVRIIKLVLKRAFAHPDVAVSAFFTGILLYTPIQKAIDKMQYARHKFSDNACKERVVSDYDLNKKGDIVTRIKTLSGKRSYVASPFLIPSDNAETFTLLEEKAATEGSARDMRQLASEFVKKCDLMTYPNVPAAPGYIPPEQLDLRTELRGANRIGVVYHSGRAFELTDKIFDSQPQPSHSPKNNDTSDKTTSGQPPVNAAAMVPTRSNRNLYYALALTALAGAGAGVAVERYRGGRNAGRSY